MELSTDTMTLLPADPKLIRAYLEGGTELADLLEVDVPEDWPVAADAFAFWLSPLELDPGLHTWASWLFIHDKDKRLIGDGGYRGKPEDGVVEIGYNIIPAYRRKGLATEAAGALASRAFYDRSVNEVTAETLADHQASQAVLQKLGMTKRGQYENENGDDVILWGVDRNTWNEQFGF